MPVLQALSERRLKLTMPVEHAPGTDDRPMFTYLEALGRLLSGIAPWIELRDTGNTEEDSFRRKIAVLARESIDAATDPASPDFMNFTEEYQPIVDAAFLSQAILRAPNELWVKLPVKVRDNLVRCLETTRTRKPGFSNWLLFGATVEAGLCKMSELGPKPIFWDKMRIDFAVRQHEQWYRGDGAYSDGPNFHFDYYNSFVIQPMLLDILATVDPTQTGVYGMKYDTALVRSQRWAAVQERLISPEGTFPVIGRSMAYRFGALQSLAQMAILRKLPDGVSPAQVRCAMTAVMKRMCDMPGMFDENGWLTIGFCGHQPSIGEGYISTGSTYLCAAAFLPLGLPASDPLWSDPPAMWTSQVAWGGIDLPADHAI